MNENKSTQKRLGLIVDLDETVCTELDVPVETAVAVLRRVDEQTVDVHYVTARTGVFREETERFLEAHRLPGRTNVHYCPDSLDSWEHKRRKHLTLSRELAVIASIGDSEEEEEAAAAVGMCFVKVDAYRPAEAWVVLEGRISEAGGFGVRR